MTDVNLMQVQLYFAVLTLQSQKRLDQTAPFVRDLLLQWRRLKYSGSLSLKLIDVEANQLTANETPKSLRDRRSSDNSTSSVIRSARSVRSTLKRNL